MDVRDSHSPGPGSAGLLRDLQMPELLWQLHEAGRTGCLKVSQGEVIKQLWLLRGDPVFARSNQSADRLTDRLLARGLLSRAQFATAQTLIAGNTGKRVGELMIDAGLIDPRELDESLVEHLLRMLDSMFLWQDGRWEFTPDVACAESVTLNVPTAAIIMGGARHRIPLRRLWEAVGARDLRPLLSADDRGSARPALLHELALEPSESQWISQLDGTRDLATMLADFDADEHELLSLVYTLKMIRRLELLTPEPLPFARQRPPDPT